MSSPHQAKFGFQAIGDSTRFFEIKSTCAVGGVWGNWFGVISVAGVETTLDLGVAPGESCPDAQRLKIKADGNFITFFIDGIVKGSLPTPAGFLLLTFFHYYRAIYNTADQVIVQIRLHTDYSCGSQGRTCTENPPS